MAETKPKPPTNTEVEKLRKALEKSEATVQAQNDQIATLEKRLAETELGPEASQIAELQGEYENFRTEAMATLRMAQERIEELESGGASGGLPYVKSSDPKLSFLEICGQTGPDQDWLYSERFDFSMDETYNAETLLIRAKSSLDRAFAPSRLGGYDRSGQPTCATFPHFDHANRLVVTVAIVRGAS